MYIGENKKRAQNFSHFNQNFYFPNRKNATTFIPLKGHIVKQALWVLLLPDAMNKQYFSTILIKIDTKNEKHNVNLTNEGVQNQRKVELGSSLPSQALRHQIRGSLSFSFASKFVPKNHKILMKCG